MRTLGTDLMMGDLMSDLMMSDLMMLLHPFPTVRWLLYFEVLNSRAQG